MITFLPKQRGKLIKISKSKTTFKKLMHFNRLFVTFRTKAKLIQCCFNILWKYLIMRAEVGEEMWLTSEDKQRMTENKHLWTLPTNIILSDDVKTVLVNTTKKLLAFLTGDERK